jgi:redox-sensitive bicupin YhaK (pirin superfamily)
LVSAHKLASGMAKTNTQSSVIISGQPHDHPIVQYGPFVVTSNEEVYQAMLDYQSHSNGFEKAKNWQSEIGKAMLGY